MRGQPVHGFRFTEKRIEIGALSAKLLADHVAIEKREKQGKPLTGRLLKAKKELDKNRRLAQKHGLLKPSVRKKHAVDKSALRRDVLLKKAA